MKVAELTGAELDLWVARAVGKNNPTLRQHWNIERRAAGEQIVWITGTSEHDLSHHYCPSSDWSKGGPIIEREGINVRVHATHNGKIVSWAGEQEWPMSKEVGALGPTALIAAMRCYVASKFGDEVQEPQQ